MSRRMFVLGLPSRFSREIALLDDPPMGHLQAVVAHKLDQLGKSAYGYKALEEISCDVSARIDHSQVYGAIHKLLNKEFIVLVETRPQQGGPPLKIYKLTAAGQDALKRTIEHHTALASYFSSKSSRVKR